MRFHRYLFAFMMTIYILFLLSETDILNNLTVIYCDLITSFKELFANDFGDMDLWNGTYQQSGNGVKVVPPLKNDFIRKYKWYFKGQEYMWETVFPKKLYDYYKNKPRPFTNDFSLYVKDPKDDKFIREIVNLFKETSRDMNFSRMETAKFVISFVQGLPYSYDNETTPYDEYPRYPIETLVDNGGDCEDSSILAASLLLEMGIDVVLLRFPEHMAVGIKCNGSEGYYYKDDYGNIYCYLETTNSGWDIGQMPEEYKNRETVIRYLH